MFCPQCGKSNDIYGKFCSGCGSALPKNDQDLPAAQTELIASNNSVELYKASIGSKNQSYYMRFFQRFESDGKIAVSWNWPAFFITFYWLLYRKMWRNALIYFLLPYIVMIPLGIIGAMSGSSADAVNGFGYILYIVATFLLPPLYANALYYKHCNTKIKKAKASSRDLQDQITDISEKGGTSNAALIILLVFVFIAIIGILAAIALPAYQDYTTRAKVSEALVGASSAKYSVEEYIENNGKIPTNIEETGFVEQSKYIESVYVNPENAEISIVVNFSPIQGKSLIFSPSLDENKKIVWGCYSNDIEKRFLPQACKQ